MGLTRWHQAINQERSNDRMDRGHPEYTAQEVNKELDKFWNISIEAFDNKRFIAVGGGRGLIHAVNNADRTVSIDPIYGEYDIDIQRSPANIVRAAGESIPIESNSFDTAFSHHVLEHTHRPQKILEEVYDVLAPGGKYYLQVLDTPLPKPVRDLISQQDLLGIETAHPYMFRASEIEQMLEEAGFDYSVTYHQKLPINQLKQGISKKTVGEFIYKHFKRQRNFALVARVPE